MSTIKPKGWPRSAAADSCGDFIVAEQAVAVRLLGGRRQIGDRRSGYEFAMGCPSEEGLERPMQVDLFGRQRRQGIDERQQLGA